MDFVNWLMVGFWGCAGVFVLCALFCALAIAHIWERGAEETLLSVLPSTILSFFGMCFFGMFLWN
jgi:hypothetical protein